MIGVRLSASRIKKIGKIAEALSANRSGAIRWLLERALDSGLATMLLRQGRGKGMTGRIVQSYAAKMKAEAAQAAADRAPDNAEAQAKASQAKREAIDRERAVTDPQYARLSRRPSAKSPLTPSRKLSQAEVKAHPTGPRSSLAALAFHPYQ
ncbi:MAG: hypothetical protein WBW73_19575 [Rhodoplanes sp.]